MRRHLVLVTIPFLAAASLGLTVLPASADTQTTCSSTMECKTVTVDSSGKLTSGSTSGVISFTGLGASTTYTLPDVIEGLGTNMMFIGGSYHLAFSASCASGSATSGTYTVSQGASTFPMTPPTANTGSFATITTNGSGAFSCAYTLTYPTIDASNDSGCDAHLCSVKNDVWVMSGTTKVTQVASDSVPPGGAPPTPIPEAPFAILLPIGIVAVAGLGMLAWRRRLITQA